MKAWLFLTDVEEDGRPLTYVAGSHRPSAERLGMGTSQERRSPRQRRSAFRTWIAAGCAGRIERSSACPSRRALPSRPILWSRSTPTAFTRAADSDKPTKRVEIWAYSRRTPFLPWTGGGLMSWQPIADRRARWLNRLGDWADRRGLAKQHWMPARPAPADRLLDQPRRAIGRMSAWRRPGCRVARSSNPPAWRPRIRWPSPPLTRQRSTNTRLKAS